MSEDLKIIKRKIRHAREWALKHFNAEQAERTAIIDADTLELLPPTAYVEFPDVDRMIVRPSFLGTESLLAFEYRLAFYPDGSTAWIGKHPLWHHELAPLKVGELDHGS